MGADFLRIFRTACVLFSLVLCFASSAVCASAAEYSLQIMPADNNPVSVGADTKNTVGELKQIIEKKMDIPAEQQTLSFSGKTLDDEKKLSSYSIPDKGFIYMEIKLSRDIINLASEAAKILDNVKIGVEEGEYPASSIKSFLRLIDESRRTAQNSVSMDEIRQQFEILQNAVDTFKASAVNEEAYALNEALIYAANERSQLNGKGEELLDGAINKAVKALAGDSSLDKAKEELISAMSEAGKEDAVNVSSTTYSSMTLANQNAATLILAIALMVAFIRKYGSAEAD